MCDASESVPDVTTFASAVAACVAIVGAERSEYIARCCILPAVYRLVPARLIKYRTRFPNVFVLLLFKTRDVTLTSEPSTYKETSSVLKLLS